MVVLTQEEDHVELDAVQFGWVVENLGFPHHRETWGFHFGRIWGFSLAQNLGFPVCAETWRS
jgi:hypothetical protein